MILLVEDEINIATPLLQFLKGEGFAVEHAANAAEAAAAMRLSPPKLVLLDWMLPDRPGVDLLREWRRDRIACPVILLTARHELIDKVLGLELGADDYMTKPFEPRELVARIRARLRTSPAAGLMSAKLAAPALVAAGVTIDLEAREVRFHEALVELTKMEFELLKLLIENKNKVFSRDELLNRVWGYDAYPTTRTIDTHILQLRQKFTAELFETVRGIGYRFRDPGAEKI